MKRLLAKSYDRDRYPNEPPDYALLTQHSRDVAAACKALAKVAGSVALANAGLDAGLIDDFSKTLLANGWMQDLGKANSHFQRMVEGQPEIIQLLRHETISGLLFCLDQRLCEWLIPLGNAKLIAVWGAMGHHRKFDARTSHKEVTDLTVYATDEDFRNILKEMAEDLELAEPPIFDSELIIAPNRRDVCDLPARESLNQIKKEFKNHESEFADEESRRFLALVKAFGIAADVAASAVARRGELAKNYSLEHFVTSDLSKGLKPSHLTELIHSWAWKSIKSDAEQIDVTRLPAGFIFRDFQNDVESSLSRLTLAMAGCGSGKSLAAYLWARQWCKKFMSEGRDNFRLFFCLPTTGTTTEHFKDYALESGIPADQISLTHSRSSVDLETIAETAIQEEASEDLAQAALDALKAEQDKIEALALWSTPLVVTTADTVLGLMANARRSIYTAPAIMHSAIVFDEIHALDDYLFGHLLVFLKNFPQLPVLLMTASLPEQRRRSIEQVRPDLHCIRGDQRFEDLPRYCIEYPVENDAVWQEVEQCIANKGQVLWVRNRVDWANKTYHTAKGRFPGIPVNVYHSRLRYKDRSHRHRQVIDHFKHEGQAAILVATQVAEMSLDLSAELLITDIAPVPALIQRMGRLNRRATPKNPGRPKKALICPLVNPKNDALPYEGIDINTAKTWIDQLMTLNRALSQRDLAQQFAAVSDASEYDYKKAEERACFFGIPGKSGLWRTRPGSTRAQGYTISVILERDYKNCKEYQYGEPSRDWLRKHEVSIPIKDAALKWKQVAGIRIARDADVEYDYDENTREGTGAAWRGD